MRGETILIVDDDKAILYTLTKILSTVDLNVISCEDYQEVQEVLGKETVHLFLVDYHLNGRDGADVIRMIRKKDKRVPIVVLTGEESPDVLNRVKEAGADDYALKPIRALDLISRIEAHLNFRSQTTYYTDHSTGINSTTMEKIRKVFLSYDDYIEAEQVAQESGISYKSTCRYIKYMTERGMLEVDYQYQKQGRPRSCYRLKKYGSDLKA